MISFFRKLKSFGNRRAKEEELHDGIQCYPDEEAAERQAEGLTADETKWAA